MSSRGSSGLSVASANSLGSAFTFRPGTARRSVVTASTRRQSLLADVDLSKRPVTGSGGGLARQRTATAAMPTRAIESSGYYSNLLQQRSEVIFKEIQRLEHETEQMMDSEVRRKVENEHKNAVQDIQQLEWALADLNLAKDKARSGASQDEIRDEAIAIANRNKTLEHEIDEIFVARKRVESKTLKLESEMKDMRAAIEQQIKEKDDPEMLYKYEMFLDVIEVIQAEKKELQKQSKPLEANDTQSRYKKAKERVDELKAQLRSVNNDMELSTMETEHDARKHLLDKAKRINGEQQNLDKQILTVQSAIDSLVDEETKLRSQRRMEAYRPKVGSSVIEVMHKMDDEQKKFLADFEQRKAELEKESNQIIADIELLNQALVKKNAAKELSLPTKEEMKLMQEEAQFTSKHLDSNKQTTILLIRQQKARELELEKILTLEDKIDAELTEIETKTSAIKNELSGMQSEEDLQTAADSRRDKLVELIEDCSEKTESLTPQLAEASAKYEQLKKSLEGDSNWDSVRHLKSKLQENEQDIIEIQGKIDELKGNTGYADQKAECMTLVNKINEVISAKQ